MTKNKKKSNRNVWKCVMKHIENNVIGYFTDTQPMTTY